MNCANCETPLRKDRTTTGFDSFCYVCEQSAIQLLTKADPQLQALPLYLSPRLVALLATNPNIVLQWYDGEYWKAITPQVIP